MTPFILVAAMKKEVGPSVRTTNGSVRSKEPVLHLGITCAHFIEAGAVISCMDFLSWVSSPFFGSPIYCRHYNYITISTHKIGVENSELILNVPQMT